MDLKKLFEEATRSKNILFALWKQSIPKVFIVLYVILYVYAIYQCVRHSLGVAHLNYELSQLLLERHEILKKIVLLRFDLAENVIEAKVAVIVALGKFFRKRYNPLWHKADLVDKYKILQVCLSIAFACCGSLDYCLIHNIPLAVFIREGFRYYFFLVFDQYSYNNCLPISDSHLNYLTNKIVDDEKFIDWKKKVELLRPYLVRNWIKIRGKLQEIQLIYGDVDKEASKIASFTSGYWGF